MSSRGVSRKCNATRADGQPCAAWAVRGSDPPLCAAHSGRTGAPRGNRNAEKHGWYSKPERPPETIDDAIALAGRKLDELDAYMGELTDPEQIIRYGSIILQGASRLGRLLRDKRALSGESADSILQALSQAIDEIGTELGIDLGQE